MPRVSECSAVPEQCCSGALESTYHRTLDSSKRSCFPKAIPRLQPCAKDPSYPKTYCSTRTPSRGHGDRSQPQPCPCFSIHHLVRRYAGRCCERELPICKHHTTCRDRVEDIGRKEGGQDLVPWETLWIKISVDHFFDARRRGGEDAPERTYDGG